MTTEFETVGSVMIEIDQGSLRGARKTVEDEIGSVTVDARADRAGGIGSPRTDGGVSSMGLAGGAGVVEELGDQTELLADILDEIEKGNVSGAGGGGGGAGGGTGAGGGAGGMFDEAVGTIGGLAAWSQRGRITSLASRAAPSTMAGGAATGVGLGLTGVNAMDRMGMFSDIEDFGSQMGQDSSQWMRDASNFVPGASTGAALPGVSQMIFGGSQEGGDGTFWGNRMRGAERAWSGWSEIQERRLDTGGDVVDETVDASSESSSVGGTFRRLLFGGGDGGSPGEEFEGAGEGIAGSAYQGSMAQRSRRGMSQERQAANEYAASSPVQQTASGGPPQWLQEQRAANARAAESPVQNTGSGGPPQRVQEQRASNAQASQNPAPPQVTNDITIEIGQMSEVSRKVEREISRAMEEIDREFGGSSPGARYP